VGDHHLGLAERQVLRVGVASTRSICSLFCLISSLNPKNEKSTTSAW
jgi:hypothetical protein